LYAAAAAILGAMRKLLIVLGLIVLLAASCTHVRPSDTFIAGPAGSIRFLIARN
jgi:hypothetical protein